MPGQIIKRGDGTWLVRVALGRDSKGTRRYHNKTIKGTKKDAERYRTKVLRELDTGSFVEASDRDLAGYLREWLNGVAAARVKPRTLEDYTAMAERHIIPAIGHKRLSRLTPMDIQQVYAGLLSSGLSGRTIRYVHSVLHNSLEQAVRWRMVAQNPAKSVDLPKHDRREMRALTAQEAATFVTAARGTRFEALWVLLLTSGLRPGEALALKWADLVGDRVHVQRSLSWSRLGQWELSAPKTARARRTVTLPPSTLQALQQHRALQAAERLRAGPEWEDRDLVFCNHRGGPLEWRLLAQRYFKPLARAAGLPGIRPYDLRHSCATLLLAAGENVKVVSERLGHASATLTLDVYSHVLPHMQQRAAERLEDLVFGVAAS